MNRIILLLIILTGWPSAAVFAQQWSLYGGAGASYDGFLRDASVTTAANKWPFMISGGVVLGGGYKAENGFDFFTESTIGFVNIKLPVPGVKHPNDYLSMLMVKLMAGSGPRIETAGGNAIRPYIQLGAEYLDNYAYASSSSSDDYTLSASGDFGTKGWSILFGAGIDYQFSAKVPSGVNLSFTFTPLNIMRDPYKYSVTSAAGSSDIALQGRLLQVMLSYRVHLNLGKRRGDY